jgi:hypothetical protein
LVFDDRFFGQAQPMMKSKKLLKREKDALQKFLSPTAEKRTPTPQTVISLFSRGLLERAGFDDESFPKYVTTTEGRRSLFGEE